MNPLRRWLLLAASVAALPMVPLEVVAQAYPSRPISMIVPASAGGPADAITVPGQGIPAVDQLTPQALGAFQNAEIDSWWPIVKAAGIKAE